MLNFIKKNIFIIFTFSITLSIGFLTFLTFIDKSFINLSDQNLQYLLIINVGLLIFLFLLIFVEVNNSLKNDIDISGSNANRKYITFFALFTLIPSILISLFSLFLLSYALDKYLDKKITTAVNNSYEIAKSYTEEVKTKTQSEIILIAYDLNKSANLLKININQFKSFLNTQKLIRRMDEVHIINSTGDLYLTTLKDSSTYQRPLLEALDMVTNDKRPLKIINAYKNRSASIIKLESFENKYLYIVKCTVCYIYMSLSINRYTFRSCKHSRFVTNLAKPTYKVPIFVKYLNTKILSITYYDIVVSSVNR